MNVTDYDFNLPDELIAQHPLEDRSSSKLLILNDDNSIIDKNFSDLIDYLDENDVLVLNDTKVIPARLFGVKEETGAKIELLLLKEVKEDIWQCLVKPAKRIKIGDKVSFGEGLLVAECINSFDEGLKEFKMHYQGIYLEVLEQLGTMPLPPYIHEQLEDQDRYQTVYSKVAGSVAAPTAGLHFTDDIFDKLKTKNIQVEFVTLHVGLGTFRPVSVDNLLDHKMHSEYYEISKQTADNLNEAKSNNKRIIAVGTTSIRTLESVYNKYGEFREDVGETDIFIYPGYEFKAVDSLITNFHLPKSTLMMLISALRGREEIMNAYQHAIKEQYRFFSFGDSMFINMKRGV